jgi:hypothetical protein
VELAFLTRPVRLEAASVPFELFDDAAHRRDRAGVVVPGGRHPHAPGFVAAIVERDPLDLRTTDIDPDPHRI